MCVAHNLAKSHNLVHHWCMSQMHTYADLAENLVDRICDCGHTALAHHGLDARERRDAGCQTNTMRDDWCRCVKTCQIVMEGK